MNFTKEEITQALRLRELGIPWSVKAGLYVYDHDAKIRPGSPFQDHVYFLLDVACFDDYFTSREQLQSSVTWLPTWRDAREKLEELKVESKRVAYHLAARNSLIKGTELLDLYELLEMALTGESPDYATPL
ncbi:MAG: hypothetical protein AAF497_05865 [Planctomycetota bacterium]